MESDKLCGVESEGEKCICKTNHRGLHSWYTAMCGCGYELLRDPASGKWRCFTCHPLGVITADICLFPGCANHAIPELDMKFCSAHAMCCTMTKREIEGMSDEEWVDSMAPAIAEGIQARISPAPPGVPFSLKIKATKSKCKSDGCDRLEVDGGYCAGTEKQARAGRCALPGCSNDIFRNPVETSPYCSMACLETWMNTHTNATASGPPSPEGWPCTTKACHNLSQSEWDKCELCYELGAERTENQRLVKLAADEIRKNQSPPRQNVLVSPPGSNAKLVKDAPLGFTPDVPGTYRIERADGYCMFEHTELDVQGPSKGEAWVQAGSVLGEWCLGVHPPAFKALMAFDKYAAMDAPDLPEEPMARLQVELCRWEVREFGGGNIESSTLGVNEEIGELADAFIYLAAAKSGAGRLAHAVLKRKQGIRGFDDTEKYREEAADAIADIMIFAIQVATKLRIDAWTNLSATAEQVMGRKWSEPEHVVGYDPASPNVTIRKIEVKSDDPDLFARQVVSSFKAHTNGVIVDGDPPSDKEDEEILKEFRKGRDDGSTSLERGDGTVKFQDGAEQIHAPENCPPPPKETEKSLEELFREFVPDSLLGAVRKIVSDFEDTLCDGPLGDRYTQDVPGRGNLCPKCHDPLKKKVERGEHRKYGYCGECGRNLMGDWCDFCRIENTGYNYCKVEGCGLLYDQENGGCPDHAPEDE